MFFSTKARLESGAVWETLSFVFNGIVFILLGLQLPHIMRATSASSDCGHGFGRGSFSA